MKAQVEASGTAIGGVRDGKVQKSKHHRTGHVKSSHKEEENGEIKAYLTKLQEICPMPKTRRLSKLEVITHVIDYIRDLRTTLGLPPSMGDNDFDMESASIISQVASPIQAITLNVINSNPSSTSSNTTSSSSSHHHPQHQRQPLCVISNPSNVSGGGSCASQEIPQLMDKSPSADVDTRPVSY